MVLWAEKFNSFEGVSTHVKRSMQYGHIRTTEIIHN